MCFIGAPLLVLPDGFSIWYKCPKCSCYIMKSPSEDLFCPHCSSPLTEAGFTA